MKLTYLQTLANMKLFTTGFLQVFFVAINTVFITHLFYIGIVVASFLISFLWTLNVRSVTFGSKWDRVIYASGASVGCLAGVLISNLFV